MRLALWRWVMWAGIALGLSFVAETFATLREPVGYTGIYARYLGGPNATYRIIRLDPDSPGARAGLQNGDLLAPVPNGRDNGRPDGQVLPGDRHEWLITSTGRRVVVVAEPKVDESGIALALTYALIQLVMLLGAAVLTARASGERAARLLTTFFVAFALGTGGPSPQGTPRWLFATWSFADPALISLAAGACLAFSTIFPRASPSGIRRILERAAWPTTILFCVVGLGFESALFFGAPPDPRILTAIQMSWLVVLAAVAVAFLAGDREVAGVDRQRLRWVAYSLILGFSGPAVWTILTLRGIVDPRIDPIQLSVAAIPLGTGYAILRHRVIDVGFVVNRALVFAAVSATVVIAMGILEWVLEKTVVEVNHVTSVSLEVALALVLGYFLRRIHGRVDRLVDALFFRERHRAESTLNAFARDAHFITELRTLLERTCRVLIETGEATFATVWTLDDDGTYRPVTGAAPAVRLLSENDPAIVRMKATREPVDLAELGSALDGRLALPMLVRATLTGAIVCGPKTDGEEYDPDEIATLAHLAHEVGLAIEALRVELLKREVERLGVALPTLVELETDEAASAS